MRRLEVEWRACRDLLADTRTELDMERQARQAAEAQLERLLQEMPPHLADDVRRRHLDAWRGTPR
jgi:hypothetical protein